jgi:hypothetical protein
MLSLIVTVCVHRYSEIPPKMTVSACDGPKPDEMKRDNKKPALLGEDAGFELR